MLAVDKGTFLGAIIHLSRVSDAKIYGDCRDLGKKAHDRFLSEYY